uniref:Uncharacterized protein n=1 Tax=Oryza meridionalis TaxID=40149 RepID=A0A0E0C3W5_9ORYZ
MAGYREEAAASWISVLAGGSDEESADLDLILFKQILTGGSTPLAAAGSTTHIERLPPTPIRRQRLQHDMSH